MQISRTLFEFQLQNLSFARIFYGGNHVSDPSDFSDRIYFWPRISDRIRIAKSVRIGVLLGSLLSAFVCVLLYYSLLSSQHSSPIETSQLLPSAFASTFKAPSFDCFPHHFSLSLSLPPHHLSVSQVTSGQVQEVDVNRNAAFFDVSYQIILAPISLFQG